MEQRSDEWFSARLGKVTASRVADVIAKTKSGYSASRTNYKAQLVAERLTGIQQESFSNSAMEWGTKTEPEARAAFELDTGCLVTEVGFIDHPTIKNSGASPDGLIGDDSLIEIKCPNTSTHIEYIKGEKVPEKYKPQMTWQMLCTGRKTCFFVSYDPRLGDGLDLAFWVYEFDSEYAGMIEKEVSAFLKEVDDDVATLEKIRKGSK